MSLTKEDRIRGKIQHSFIKFRKFCGIGEIQKREGQPMVWGWFTRNLCNHLQEFKEKMERGERPVYIIEAPPQHGKSVCLQDFSAWMAGLDPNLRIIFASFSDDLGIRANKAQQIIMSDERYRWLYWDLINSDNVRNIVGAQKNDHQIDFIGHSGSFVNTTTGGQITGKSCDLLIIDDPIKGREESNSETMREKIWGWFKNDALSRMSPRSGIILINTRWHIEDLAGKIMMSDIPYTRITYKAIADHDEEYRKKGEALIPEYKSVEFLDTFKKSLTESEWQSLFQQNPVIDGGNLFKDDWFEVTNSLPMRYDYTYITADTAYKEKQSNDYTVFTFWGKLGDKLYRVDSRRKKINAVDIEDWIEPWIRSKMNNQFRYVWIEPQGHGIYLNQSFKKKGIPVPYEEDIKEYLVRKTDKVERAHQIIPRVDRENKNVVFYEGCPDHEDFMSELVAFPNGKHDDSVDTFIDGVNIGFARVQRDWSKIVDLA